MNVDYQSVLTKAVVGKDAAARDQIYKDAFSLIRRSFDRETAVSHIAALEDAIRQIERNIEEEAGSAVAINEVLSTNRRWIPLAIGALAMVAIVAVGALLYGHMGPKEAAPSPKVARTQQEAVMADLKPGVDGGSTAEGLPFAMQRQVVFYRTTVVPGSIVIDRENRFLYLIDVNNSARRYGVGIAQECLRGGSLHRVANKLEWPERQTPDALVATAGRPGSVLGARALLLDKPGLLIHGTNSPKTIGHLVSTGCIRLVNDDVEDLYRRVSLETRVVFLN